MTREEAIDYNKNLRMYMKLADKNQPCKFLQENYEALDMAIKALEQEPCKDAISRQAVLDATVKKNSIWNSITNSKGENLEEIISQLPPVTPQPKIEYCKDCKWWKDSDGVYRRGVGAESKCPMNTKVVRLGLGYCYRFKPLVESGDENDK